MCRISIALLFLALFTGCEFQEKEPQAFFKRELFSVFKVSGINEAIVGKSSFELAPGSWHSAMRLSARVNGFEVVDYCLLVKVPYELDPGQIKFVKAHEAQKPCSEYLFEKPVSEIRDFYNLLVEYDKAKLVIKLDKENHVYEFLNLANMSLRYSVSASAALPAQALLKEGHVCYQVNDDCTSSEDRCSQCEGGSYLVKNSACATAYSKVCGVDECGQKNRPACIRGHMASGVMDYCIQDSPVGFCSGDNRVACVNGLLTCE